MSSSTNFTRVADLESASNKSKAKYTELSNNIGNLSALATTDKTSIVAAINEVAGNAGGETEINAYRYKYPKIVYSMLKILASTNPTFSFESIASIVSSKTEGVSFLLDTLEGAEGTIFENASLNMIATIHNQKWEFYTPEDYTLYIMPSDLIGPSYYDIYYVNYAGEWTYLSFEKQFVKKVLYVFEAGTGDTLPSTCKRGDKFLLQGDGYTKVYTALAADTWDDGYQLHSKVATGTNNNTTRYINFTGKGSCKKFSSATCTTIVNADNPYVNSNIASPLLKAGGTISAMGTGDTYTYNGYYVSKNNNAKIRVVTDIVNQVYSTIPTASNAPAEDKILIISNSYKRVYTNTNNTKRWNSKTYIEMPQNKAYLSLADKRIYSNENEILKFGPLLDGEMFYYEGDKSYYIYRLATDSFEKVGTTTATLTATLV